MQTVRHAQGPVGRLDRMGHLLLRGNDPYCSRHDPSRFLKKAAAML
jgi:hypothetical protein